MATLDDYLTLARGIKAFYEAREGLQRQPGEFQVPEMANWLYHGIEAGHDLEWIRQAIRADQGGEWRSKHPGEPPAPPEPPSEPPPPPPEPPSGPLQPPPPVQRTRLFQVTTEVDGPVAPRTYGYWSNAWVEPGGETILVFCGLRNGPAFFRVYRRSDLVEPLGRWNMPYGGETEGWYWDLQGWIYMAVGPRLLRIHPGTGEEQVVGDISGLYPGCDLWQPHSSLDGSAHSATVRQIVSGGKYPNMATVVFRPGSVDRYPAQGDLDESQISPDAQDLVIKETLEDGLSNRFIRVGAADGQRIRKAEGAIGHSDLGPGGLLIGEWSPPAGSEHGQCVRWDLQPGVPPRRRELFPTWNLGHLSYQAGRWLRSDGQRLSLLDPDTGQLTPLWDHGMVITGSEAYDFQTGANLDPSGTVVCFRSNNGGPTQHLFVLDLAPL